MANYLLKFDAIVIAPVVILAFVGRLYHMWRRHAVKSLVPLPGPVSKSFIFGEFQRRSSQKLNLILFVQVIPETCTLHRTVWIIITSFSGNMERYSRST